MEENEENKWVRIACSTSRGFNSSDSQPIESNEPGYYFELLLNVSPKPESEIKPEYVYTDKDPVCIKVYTPSRYALGVTIHPQQEFEDLGYDVLNYEFVGMADCAIMQLDRLPESLPSYAERCRWDWNKHCLIKD